MILTLIFTLPLIACNDSGNSGTPNNGTVDVTYLHSSSKDMMGLRKNGEPGQENLSQLSTEPAEYEQYINLDEKYQRLQPSEYMPIFREKIAKYLSSNVHEFGSRYLTRSMHFQHDYTGQMPQEEWEMMPQDAQPMEASDVRPDIACVYVTDEDHVIIKDDGEKNISVVDSKATILEMRNEEACHSEKDEQVYLQKDFTRRETAEQIEEYFNTEERGAYQIYKVSENSFVEKNKWGVFFYHFRDDGLVHMDGILEYEGIKSLMSHIPQPAVDEDYIRSNFDGKTMEINKQVPCGNATTPDGEEADYCSERDGSTEIFQLDSYLK